MLYDIDDFNAACTAYERGMLRAAIPAAVTLALCFGIVLPFRDAVQAYYQRQCGDVAAEFLLGLTPLPAVVVMFFCFWVHHRRLKRIGILHCPHCGQCVVSGQRLVVATRNCFHCGRRMVADPVDK